MASAAALDGWEALVEDDGDLAAFLGDDEGVIPALIVPRAANDNGPRMIHVGGELLPRAVWEPRYLTVE
jgi:hypothetical protein